MGSSRLPGKILKPLAGKPLLWHVINRCKAAKLADLVIVATTKDKSDNQIEKFCKNYKIPHYRGSVDNVLERYCGAAKKYDLATVARVTADCPLVDPVTIDRVFSAYKNSKCDYVSNIVPGERTFPRGLDVEVFSFSALEKAYKEARDKMETEHVTPYIWQNKKKEYKICGMVTASKELSRNYRLTVDYPEDFALVDVIYEKFKEHKIIPTVKVIKFLDEHPEIAMINADCEQRHNIHAPVNILQRKTR